MSDNNWPDPARPGVPLNPERDGWHWLLANTDKGPQPDAACWGARVERWFVGCEDAFCPNEIVNRGWLGYLGPCLTPAEVDARVKEAKRDALEEAIQAAANSTHRREIIEAIRALKGEGDE